MDKIKILEVKKLLKELEYVESDFEYRSEVISGVDVDFIKCVNDFLILHPDLKDIYDQKITDKINQSIKNRTEDEEREINDEYESEGGPSEDGSDLQEKKEISKEEEDIKAISYKLRKLYREIAKLTHPDKVKKKRLNDIYIKATDYYNNNDTVGIYKICSDLDIDYDIEDEDRSFISTKIDLLKRQIVFLESTFTWKWYGTSNIQEKDQIIINYIKLRIQ